MRALTYHGGFDVRIENVPDPRIEAADDVLLRVTATAICGSDLHLYRGKVPGLQPGDILGHEFMGIVEEVGPGVGNLSVGDRVVVPFPIACGNCNNCSRELYSLCENSNPNAGIAEKLFGYSPAGLFGYSHMLGGFAGGQAEYVRVPFADVGPLKIENDLTDEQVLFLTDILPTGYMGAEMCDITPGDIVAVWGAGPVGLFAAESARLLGAHKVIVIDRFDYRLDLAAKHIGAETLNYERVDVPEALKELTGGRGPDACIEAVGMEAHHPNIAINAYDKAKQLARSETERPHALRQAITSCRNGGTVSIIGVFGGMMDKFPIGSMMNRSLTIRQGQAHVHRYLRPLLKRIENGEIDPTFVITHRISLDEVPDYYTILKEKQDDCVKVVITP